MINWLSGFFSGIAATYLYWISTHSCYFTIAGVLCTTHQFSLEHLWK
jgi:hypothetical protein